MMKLAKFLFSNLAAWLALLLIVLAVGLLLRNPNLVNKNLPLALPKTIVKGESGQALQAGDVTIKVEALGRIPVKTLPNDIRLSSRAKLDFTDGYLWLELSIRNLGETITLDYEGVGQTVEFLLGVRKPQPQVVSRLLSRDVAIIANDKVPLPSGTLAGGFSWQGTVAFPVTQSMTELSLLLIPAKTTSAQDSSLPAFEINLAD